MLHTLLFDLRVALVFVVMLVVLVFAHEFGHYIFARIFGMGIEEFAIGFGRPKLGTYYRRKYRIPLTKDQVEAWERGEYEMPLPEGLPKALEPDLAEPGTIVQEGDALFLEETTKFTVRAWPLGGFVRIKGSTPEEQGKETQVPGGFYSKAPWKRLIVLFAGPMFSVLTGMLIFIPYLMTVGKPMPDFGPVIGNVAENGRGAEGGLKKGDRVVSVDGAPVSRFFDMVAAVRSKPEQKVSFEVERDGKNLTLVVIPTKDAEPTPVLGPDLEYTTDMAIQGRLSIGPVVRYEPIGLIPAAKEAIAAPFQAISSLASGVMHPAQLKNEVGGPVSIVRSTAEATNDGIGQVVLMAATLSISLGIFNLLPIYPLDGGQMLVSLAEMFRGGRRLSMKAQNLVATLGFSALLMLVAFVFVIDFQRLHSDVTKARAASKK